MNHWHVLSGKGGIDVKKSVLLAVMMLLAGCILGACASGENRPTDANDAFQQKVFQEALEQGHLVLKRFDVEAYGNQWLSVSPKGTYLLGYQSGDQGMPLTETDLQLYHVASGEVTALRVEESEDAQDYWRALMMQGTLKAVWSADERYFTLVDYDRVVNQSMGGVLVLADTAEKKIEIVEYWNRSFIREDGGGVYQACFSPKGDKLYYSLYGGAAEQYSSRIMTMAYDIAKGTSTACFANEFDMENGETYWAYAPGMFCLTDGSIVQAIHPFFGSGRIGVRMMRPVQDGWESSICLLAENRGLKVSQLRMAGDDRCLVTYFGSMPTTAGGTVVFEKTDGHSFEVLEDSGIYNAVWSSNGRYLMSLQRQSEDAYSLMVQDYGDTEAGIRGVSAVIDGADVKDRYANLMGGNALAKNFDDGMQWGGNLVLLGSDHGAEVYEFAGVE